MQLFIHRLLVPRSLSGVKPKFECKICGEEITCHTGLESTRGFCSDVEMHPKEDKHPHYIMILPRPLSLQLFTHELLELLSEK